MMSHGHHTSSQFTSTTSPEWSQLPVVKFWPRDVDLEPHALPTAAKSAGTKGPLVPPFFGRPKWIRRGSTPRQPLNDATGKRRLHGCIVECLCMQSSLLWRQHGLMSRIHNSANEAKLTVKYLSTIVLWLRGCKNTPVWKCKVVLWWWYII